MTRAITTTGTRVAILILVNTESRAAAPVHNSTANRLRQLSNARRALRGDGTAVSDSRRTRVRENSQKILRIEFVADRT
jgi:hypothetical protein